MREEPMLVCIRNEVFHYEKVVRKYHFSIDPDSLETDEIRATFELCGGKPCTVVLTADRKFGIGMAKKIAQKVSDDLLDLYKTKVRLSPAQLCA